MKYHFAYSDDPLKEGSDITAACGDVVPDGHFAAWIDQESIFKAHIPGVNMSVNCRKCNSAVIRDRFVYVVCAGQEAMTNDAA